MCIFPLGVPIPLTRPPFCQDFGMSNVTLIWNNPDKNPFIMVKQSLPAQDHLSVYGSGMPSLSASGATIASPDSSLKPELRYCGYWRHFIP